MSDIIKKLESDHLDDLIERSKYDAEMEEDGIFYVCTLKNNRYKLLWDSKIYQILLFDKLTRLRLHTPYINCETIADAYILAYQKFGVKG